MQGGKKKALTFSYDDGVTQDLRLIRLFDKYGLKATFNLNSELLGKSGELFFGEKRVSHDKLKAEDVEEIYSDHEVAVHTLTHVNLAEQTDFEVVRQVEEDRKNLERLSKKSVCGMAYPCSGASYNECVAELIEKNTGVRYARTNKSNFSFERQNNLLLFKPTVHHTDFDKMFELGEKFLKSEPEEEQIFYIWGHSYEFDIDDSWGLFEKFLSEISGRDDVFYGTNSEVLLG